MIDIEEALKSTDPFLINGNKESDFQKIVKYLEDKKFSKGMSMNNPDQLYINPKKERYSFSVITSTDSMWYKKIYHLSEIILPEYNINSLDKLFDKLESKLC